MLRLLPLLGLLLATLGGCVEATEDWTFDGNGGGTYELVLRWDADLWRRIEDVLGAKVMARVAGDGFPLRPEDLRDGLRGLGGVEITRLEQRDAGAGMREVALTVRFERLASFLRWEVLAGRTVRSGPETPVGGAEPTQAGFSMEPIARVPVLDRVAALLDAAERPPPAGRASAAEARDPPPLERQGIGGAAGQLVGDMLKPALGRVRLAVRVHVPGEIVAVGGRRTAEGERTAEFAWSFADLRRSDADRTVRLDWKLRALDVAPTAAQTGRTDPRPGGPTGTR